MGRTCIFYLRIKRGWDGTYKGSAATVGTLVYMLQYSIEGKPYLLKGNFHLLR
jgi:hypothetical protein